MKKIFLALLMLSVAVATAQNPYIAPFGVVEDADGTTVSQPQTLLSVDVEVACEKILAGPYARYAQKFLGVRAPLTDKTVWKIVRGVVGLIGGEEAFSVGTMKSPTMQASSHVESMDEFARLSVDKNSAVVTTLESAAQAAANTIFSLRRHRLELITGEAGEHVFGAGLKAALDEIARLEQQYLELFLGKKVTTTEMRRCIVWPQSDKKQYVVCRFSPAAGLLPETDLTGDMVLLEIEPSGVQSPFLEAGVKDTNYVTYRIADVATCKVVSGGREYARAVLPIFEFGKTIKIAIPRKK